MTVKPTPAATPLNPLRKQRGADKVSRIPVKVMSTPDPQLPKPDWLRVRLPTQDKVRKLKDLLRGNKMVTVCEEASCPNLPECFSHGTATFMIMGDKCTRRCTFCDVAHGRPDALDPDEPQRLADTVATMGLKYVVITSVDRDDLRDGGAEHFTQCISATRTASPGIKIEILVPDFRGRGRMERALELLVQEPADVFNHNVETVQELYKPVRPGSDYQWSLTLLQEHKKALPHIPTKSGLMLGLGEEKPQIKQALRDLRAHDVDMLTLGQYLQPSPHHHPVLRYVSPQEFNEWRDFALSIGFTHVASGPLVRSSYHADRQASGEDVS